MAKNIDKVNKTPVTPSYTAQRGPKLTDEKAEDEYDDVFHRNIVDFPITLTGLGFYGSSKIVGGGDTATYDVEWELSYSVKPIRYSWFFFEKRNIGNAILAAGRDSYEAKIGEIFNVSVGNIAIPPNEGIEIAFALNGPKTKRMQKPDRSVAVKTGFRVVTFYFNEGSMQMPELYFKMEEDNNLPVQSIY